MKEKISKEWLENQYWTSGLTLRRIAEKCGVTHQAVHLWFQGFGIPRRTRSEGMIETRRREKKYPDKKWFVDTYINKNMTMGELASICKTGLKTITKWRMIHKIAKHPYRIGSDNHRWKGGKTIDSQGYILVLSRGHPNCNSNGRVQEHRLIAEKAMGRYLKRGEIVHHMNEDRTDNRNCNLIVCNHSFHHWLHWHRYPNNITAKQR